MEVKYIEIDGFVRGVSYTQSNDGVAELCLSGAHPFLIRGELFFYKKGKIIRYNETGSSFSLVYDISNQFVQRLLMGYDIGEYILFFNKNGKLGLYSIGSNNAIYAVLIVDDFIEFLDVDSSILCRELTGICKWNQGFLLTLSLSSMDGDYVETFYVSITNKAERVVLAKVASFPVTEKRSDIVSTIIGRNLLPLADKNGNMWRIESDNHAVVCTNTDLEICAKVTLEYGHHSCVLGISNVGESLQVFSEHFNGLSEYTMHIFNLKCEFIGFIEMRAGVTLVRDDYFFFFTGHYARNRCSKKDWWFAKVHDGKVDKNMDHVCYYEGCTIEDDVTDIAVYNRKVTCFEDTGPMFQVVPRGERKWIHNPSKFNIGRKLHLKQLLLVRGRVDFVAQLPLDVIIYIGNYLIHSFPIKKQDPLCTTWVRSESVKKKPKK